MKLSASSLLLTAIVVLPGCFAARASVGPNLSTAGHSGMTASGGFGMGWSYGEHKAIYVVPTFGVIATDHARGLAVGNLSYVDYGLALPIRVDARFGGMLPREKFGEEGRSLFGAAIAVLPWSGKSPDEHYHSEKGWTDFGPDLDMLRGLGVEVAVDASPAPSAGERGQVTATVSLVGDFSLMIAP